MRKGDVPDVTRPGSLHEDLVMAEEGFAVAAAEEEDEPVQILSELGGAVAGVADEVCQGGPEVACVAG